MSTIEDKIKLLQRKLATVERLKEISNFAENLGDPNEHPGLSKEIGELFKSFVDQQISRLEAGEDLKIQQANKGSDFTSEEISVLRSLIERVKNQAQPPQTPNVTRQAPASDKSDKIRFAMTNRHLDQKRVAIQTKDGTVKGKVVGLDAPHVIVQTDTGYTVPVELEQVTVL